MNQDVLKEKHSDNVVIRGLCKKQIALTKYRKNITLYSFESHNQKLLFSIVAMQIEVLIIEINKF